MIQALRQHILFRAIWFAVALHTLNCSVDAPDVLPDFMAENLSQNDLETVAEIVLEEVLDIPNAISEREEDDSEGGLLKIMKIELYYQRLLPPAPVTLYSLLQQDETRNARYAVYFPVFHPEACTPPPWA